MLWISILIYAATGVVAFGIGYWVGLSINSEVAVKCETDILRFENARLRAELKSLTDRDEKGRFIKSK
jgi:hypothetical protein